LSVGSRKGIIEFMRLIKESLSKKEISQIKKESRGYLKITADLKNNLMVIGPELHADGEKLLLAKGGKSENIWGGGINLLTGAIDTIAVLNLRPNLENESMEILNSKTREDFINLVKRVFNL